MAMISSIYQRILEPLFTPHSVLVKDQHTLRPFVLEHQIPVHIVPVVVPEQVRVVDRVALVLDVLNVADVHVLDLLSSEPPDPLHSQLVLVGEHIQPFDQHFARDYDPGLDQNKCTWKVK